MKQLRLSPLTKEEGLRGFQQKGWVLVDATYEPVNKPGSRRDKVIERDYPLLRTDLVNLMSDRSVPLVLIKENVCRILEPKLRDDGFNVLNCGRVVYFPATGRQSDFHRQFRTVLESAGAEW
jgi:hypothetical protein